MEIALKLPLVTHVLLFDGSHSYAAIHAKQYRMKFNEPQYAEAAMVNQLI